MQLRVWITGFFLGWISALCFISATSADLNTFGSGWLMLAVLVMGVACLAGLAGLENLPGPDALRPALAVLSARRLAPAYSALASRIELLWSQLSPNSDQGSALIGARQRDRALGSSMPVQIVASGELDGLIERLSEDYLLHLRELYEAFEQVYIPQLEAREVEVAELRHQVEQLERERNQLTSRVEHLDDSRAKLTVELQSLRSELARRLAGLAHQIERDTDMFIATAMTTATDWPPSDSRTGVGSSVLGDFPRPQINRPFPNAHVSSSRCPKWR